MFMQAIQGRADDPAALRDRLDEWVRDQAGQAEGWLGTTAGVTEEGEFIAVVRFASTEAARRNSDRPEQGRWWSRTEPHFAGPVAFHDYPEADLMLGGGSDDAGFVQVIQGRADEPDRLLELQQGSERDLAAFRPEIIGGTYGWDQEGNLVSTIYFTSEAEAREGERRMPEASEETRANYEEFNRMVTGLRYLDLREPWLWSPSR